ncbi:MAG TPA: FdhF/YdeP family oxidoreductase, partial [Myxococcota bacterium]|nr:FdhF/YdeP family oxidoreductase [Myxococcota bacterium]
KNSLSTLNALSDHQLEEMGRLVVPAIKKPGATHYQAISYSEAFDIAAAHFRALKDPNEAIFYTSGRASNEAAFLYQLFARVLGTNNLCDCSNLCHESSGVALDKCLGTGKGTVQIEDFLASEVIFLIGHNPSTNHPRMLSTLREAKKKGAKIVVINPMIEPGLMRFRHPQMVNDLLLKPVSLASDYTQIKVGGDAALFYLLLQQLINDESALDRHFIASHTSGFNELKEELETYKKEELYQDCGIELSELERLYNLIKNHKRVIYAWGMGITQSTHAVSTIEAIISIALLRGHIGSVGAGLCPVRGHSNVQGNRTVGINHLPSAAFSDRLSARFNFKTPHHHGLDVVDSIKAMLKGDIKIFMALGGNFLSASPDFFATSEALNRTKLRINLSTKLNRTHLLSEHTSLILPCLTRVEKDIRQGKEQIASVENSMSIVHASKGTLKPLRPGILGEPAIIAGIAQRSLPPHEEISWEALSNNYEQIREHIGAVVPELERYNERLKKPGGFILPNTASSRIFNTKDQRAHFMRPRPLNINATNYDLMLTTIRSHDQFNTAIYGLDDRYRGIKGQRDVVFINDKDLKRLHLKPDMRVDLISNLDGQERIARSFQIKAHAIKEGSAACYFPEANVLIALSSVAHESNTPTSKQVPIRIRVNKTDLSSRARGASDRP